MHPLSLCRSYTLILYKHGNAFAEKMIPFLTNVVKVVLQDLVRNKDFTYVKVTERYQEVSVKKSFCSHTEIIQYKKT